MVMVSCVMVTKLNFFPPKKNYEREKKLLLPNGSFCCCCCCFLLVFEFRLVYMFSSVASSVFACNFILATQFSAHAICSNLSGNYYVVAIFPSEKKHSRPWLHHPMPTKKKQLTYASQKIMEHFRFKISTQFIYHSYRFLSIWFSIICRSFSIFAGKNELFAKHLLNTVRFFSRKIIISLANEVKCAKFLEILCDWLIGRLNCSTKYK